jgi:hypothetical protein
MVILVSFFTNTALPQNHSSLSLPLSPRITITKVTTILKNHRSNIFFTNAAKRTRYEKNLTSRSPLLLPHEALLQ